MTDVIDSAPLSPAKRQRQRYAAVTERNASVMQRNTLTVSSRVTSRNVTVLFAVQQKVEIGFNEDGDALLTQTNWPDEDQIVVISLGNIGAFIDNLTDALGIPSSVGPR